MEKIPTAEEILNDLNIVLGDVIKGTSSMDHYNNVFIALIEERDKQIFEIGFEYDLYLNRPKIPGKKVLWPNEYFKSRLEGILKKEE